MGRFLFPKRFRPVGMRFISRTPKYDPCYLPICGLKIERIKASGAQKCRAAQFLTTNFFRDNPLTIAANLGGDVINPSALQFYINFITENRTLFAIVKESRELLGLAICHVTTPQFVYEVRGFADRIREVDARRYMHFLAQVHERNNLYKVYGVERLLNVDVICVARPYRRRSVAKQLMKGVMEMAKNDGITVVRFDTANHYASKVAVECGGMTAFAKRALNTFKDPRGVQWLPKDLCPPHREMEIYSIKRKEKTKKKEKELKCETKNLDAC